MKILKIEIENYRKIKAMLLELDGSNLAVAGDTGQGKTTAISVLWEALNMVGDPVSHGEKKGQIRITLGDGETEVFVTRSFTAKTAPITIMTSKGKKVSASEFASWFCGLGDNPQRIMGMKPKEQASTLLAAVKLPDGVDLDKMDSERMEASEQRLMLGRDGKRDAERLGAEPPKPERVDLSVLEAEEERARLANKERDALVVQRDNAKTIVSSAKQMLSDKEAALDRAKAALVQAETEAAAANNTLNARTNEQENLDKKISKMPEAVNTTDIRAKISAGMESNAAADRWEEWKVRANEVADLRKQYKVKDEEVKALDQAKKDALLAAEWPMDGLAIEEGVVLYNDAPLNQCGHSEQMLVCGALAAKTISQHQLRVVRMDGIESMSREDFKRLEAIFAEHDIQVLSSRVSRGDVDDGELLIVDGAVQEEK